MEYLLSTDCLTKKFKRQTAIDNISLHIRQGEIYGLIGKNGAGKTTFLKMISGLSKPTSGDITFFGYHGAERNKVISRIGVLIEAPGLYPDMSAYDNLKLKCICVGLHRPGYIENILNIVGLGNVGKKKVGHFSLGMKQRLGIAAAIMHEPELLILDEPINGLDPIGIVEIRSFLSEVRHNHGITIFISSHVLSEIEQIADIIGVMHEGHLVEEVNISELHKRNRKYIQFDLSDSEIAGKILENHYHMTDFTVQDGTVRIYDFSQSVGEINREFARNGLLVTRINDSEENLED